MSSRQNGKLNFKKNSYIYKITNLLNGKIYVGQRTTDYKIERDSYFGSGILLKKSIKKHGKENFKKEILEICRPEELNEREKFWILKEDSLIPNGYNCELTGRGGLTGKNHSKKTRLQMIETWKRKKKEGYKLIVKTERTKEQKINYSKSKIGSKNPNYGKSTWNKGKHFSEEIRNKISTTHKENGIFKFDKNPKFKEIEESVLLEILDMINKGIPKREIYEKYGMQEQRYMRHLYRKGMITKEKMPNYLLKYFDKF